MKIVLKNHEIMHKTETKIYRKKEVVETSKLIYFHSILQMSDRCFV